MVTVDRPIRGLHLEPLVWPTWAIDVALPKESMGHVTWTVIGMFVHTS